MTAPLALLLAAPLWAGGRLESSAPQAAPTRSSPSAQTRPLPSPGRVNFAPPRGIENLPGLPTSAVTGAAQGERQAAQASESPAAPAAPASRETQPGLSAPRGLIPGSDARALPGAETQGESGKGGTASDAGWSAGRRFFDRDAQRGGDVASPEFGRLMPSSKAGMNLSRGYGSAGESERAYGPEVFAARPAALAAAAVRELGPDEGYDPAAAELPAHVARARLKLALEERYAGRSRTDAAALLTLEASGTALALAISPMKDGGPAWRTAGRMTAWSLKTASVGTAMNAGMTEMRDAPSAFAAVAAKTSGGDSNGAVALRSGTNTKPDGDGKRILKEASIKQLKRAETEAPLPWSWLLPLALAALRFRREFA